MRYACLTLCALLVSGAVFAEEKPDVARNEQPIHAPVNPEAVKKIPADFHFVETGTLTVATSATHSLTAAGATGGG